MKLIIAKLENRNEYNVLWDGEEKVKKAAYWNDLKYIDKEKEEEFKEKFGFNLRDFREKSINDVKKEIEDKFNRDEEKIEEFEEFIDDLPYAPQAYPGYYCEDIILKEDVEELEKENVLFLTGDYFQDSGMSDEEYYDDYYFWWDGHNHRCSKIEELYEIECEEIDCDKVDCKDNTEQREGTYHYNCYKTNDGKIFRIFCNHYQETLDEFDEECGAGLNILE